MRSRARRVTTEIYGAFWNVARYARESAFDRREGVSTKSSLRFPRDDPLSGSRPYQPTTARAFRRALSLLPIDPGQYSFVDLGCGKGAALVLAARAGFRKVVGVELDRTLYAEARANRERLVARDPARFEKVRLTCGDAATIEFGREPTVAYLFNPFGEATVRSVLASLERLACGQPVYILYGIPVHASVITESTRFQPIVTTQSSLAAFRSTTVRRSSAQTLS